MPSENEADEPQRYEVLLTEPAEIDRYRPTAHQALRTHFKRIRNHMRKRLGDPNAAKCIQPC